MSFLQGRGLRPVTRNFRCRLGEIDLVMLDGDILVFVEVRFRAGTHFTRAGPTVDIHKQRKLARTAALFLARRCEFASRVVRFDVVAIEGDSVEWTRDAFRPADNAF